MPREPVPFGMANTNQMLMEAMGLHIPGAAFVTPNTPLRRKLTDYAAAQIVKILNNVIICTPLM